MKQSLGELETFEKYGTISSLESVGEKSSRVYVDQERGYYLVHQSTSDIVREGIKAEFKCPLQVVLDATTDTIEALAKKYPAFAINPSKCFMPLIIADNILLPGSGQTDGCGDCDYYSLFGITKSCGCYGEGGVNLELYHKRTVHIDRRTIAKLKEQYEDGIHILEFHTVREHWLTGPTDKLPSKVNHTSTLDDFDWSDVDPKLQKIIKRIKTALPWEERKTNWELFQKNLDKEKILYAKRHEYVSKNEE
jgi:hypothetical protein